MTRPDRSVLSLTSKAGCRGRRADLREIVRNCVTRVVATVSARSCGLGCALVGALLVLLGLLQAGGALGAEPHARTLIVGTKEAAPFSFKRPDGTWSGISIDLWRELATELHLDYELREHSLDALLAGLEDGSLDVVAAALTVTAEREQLFDFSHPFHTSGLGIAAASRGESSLWRVVRQIFSFAFVKALAALAIVLFLAGVLIWLSERRRNPQQFGGSKASGIWSGFWWSAVTMTTVGYGDKAPVTILGRSWALVWMFASIITISGFTATIASTLTVSQLESVVRSPDDLGSVRVASVPQTTSAEYLEKKHIRFRSYREPGSALEAVLADEADAAVYDAPILRFLVNAKFAQSLRVLPFRLERQDYALGFPEDSPLREPVNRALLQFIGSPRWEEIVVRYFGS